VYKTPISFKGPKGQLQQWFDEKTIYQAVQWILNDCVFAWKQNPDSKLCRALITDDEGREFTVSMIWPPQEPLGTCHCDAPKPCVHLAVLSIYSKYQLDQVAPFTQQIKALQDINKTFMDWLGRQSHDPFPNMARHRVIYVLDQDEEGQLYCRLYKAYLSQDDRYQVKSEINAGLLNRKQLPKFVSLADQYVMHLLNQNGLADAHQIQLNSDRDQDLLLMMLKSQRCFWKACYRPPLQLFEHQTAVPPASKQLSEQLYLNVAENAVNRLQPQPNTRKLPSQGELKFSLNLTTVLLDLPWSRTPTFPVDVGHIAFQLGQQSFTLGQLLNGQLEISPNHLESLAKACYQLEKLPSMQAAFEPPVSQAFELNDRYLGDDLTQLAPTLVALHANGWEITFDQQYRMSRLQPDQWFVDISPSSEQSEGWFDLQLGVTIDGQRMNLVPYLLKAIKTGDFEAVQQQLMLQLDEGQSLAIEKAKIKQIMVTLAELYQGSGQDSLQLNSHQLLQVAQVQNQWNEALGEDDNQLLWLGAEEMEEKAKALSHIDSLPSVPLPEGLQATLRPYQKTGYDWLHFLAQHDLHGLLADDMGLGKTLQTIAFILAQKESGAMQAPCVVIAPTSLLGNWAAETKRFAPQLKVGILRGNKRRGLYKKFQQHDLIVASYGIISRDFKQLQAQPIHMLVLDEAQAIKNRKTQVAKIIKKLSVKHRLCLTGTPVENHLGELWSIFDFLMPGLLGSEKSFQKFHQWPIEKEQNTEKMNQLKTRLAPFILRRTKTEVATELPEKNEIIKHIDLDPKQAAVYESIRLTMADEIRAAIKTQNNNAILIGNALLRLRQVCCHPALVNLQAIDATAESAKLNWLLNALPSLIEEGRKVLIFSSFTGMLAIIAEALDDLGLPYFQLTGQTPGAQRTADIAAFQAEEKPVFLISLKAGGAGINLTAADTVIHYDPWWNPAAEQQAADRAHRIGQDKQVFVYKLITRGTVEEKIHLLQRHKRALADDLLESEASINDVLSGHQWEQMLAPIDSNEDSQDG